MTSAGESVRVKAFALHAANYIQFLAPSMALQGVISVQSGRSK